MSSEAITINDLKEILGAMPTITVPRVQGGIAGEIKMYAGNDEPIGWLKCDGRAVSRTTYADLFAVIGTTYGSGDGSTTFNIPDLKGRFPIGVGGSYSLNSQGGSKDAVVVSHSHMVRIDATNQSGWSGRKSGSGNLLKDSTYTWTGSGYIIEANPTSTTGVSGTDKNLPPYIGLNFIICY